MLGAISLYAGVVPIFFYDLTMTKELPWWVYLGFFVSIFLYQTFDAIDGKHARNTKRSSPLGQLMDHGCDAITNSCITIFLGQAYLLGTAKSSLIILQAFIHVNKFNLVFLLHCPMGGKSNWNYPNAY